MVVFRHRWSSPAGGLPTKNYQVSTSDLNKQPNIVLTTFYQVKLLCGTMLYSIERAGTGGQWWSPETADEESVYAGHRPLRTVIEPFSAYGTTCVATFHCCQIPNLRKWRNLLTSAGSKYLAKPATIHYYNTGTINIGKILEELQESWRS